MKTILVVEDDSDVRNNLEELLDAEGFETLTASNGEEGYSVALTKEPDLIISDISMPVMDGFELLEKVQKHSSTSMIPFIFLTAKIETRDIRKGMANGADDYIVKPFTADDILDAISTRLKKKQKYYTEIKEFKELLLRRIPHELRTPLVGILGLSDIVYNEIDKLSKVDIKEMVDKIHSSGKRLYRRIEKFITYTDLLSQDAKRENENNFGQEIYDISEETISEQLIKKAEEFGRTRDLNIHIEKGKVKILNWQFGILLNELLENSLKFSPRGSAIFVDGKANGEYYELKILEEDKNIANIDYNKISVFKKFGREEITSEGIGMGLAIVKKIVELANGCITFESVSGILGVIEVRLTMV